MTRSFSSLVIVVMMSGWTVAGRAELSDGVREAMVWYDSLGYPDAKNLPYIRVATGRWSQTGNRTPENRFVEGFLIAEDREAFTVFICSVSELKDLFEMSEPYAPLTTMRFLRRADGEAHLRVSYEVLDLEKVAADAVERVRRAASDPFHGLRGGRPLSHRARIFAFARACQQRGVSSAANALLDFAANIPDVQTGKVEPHALREILQEQIGAALITKAEEDGSDPAVSRHDLLKVYENFATRFPASKQVAYARESADLLRKMIAEDAAHHPKPAEEMSPAEQVAEHIFQLRNLHVFIWIMHSGYPLYTRTGPGAEPITPVHRLVDLGHAAVPQLIEALDDRRFTRSLVPRFKGQTPPEVMRVGDVAQRILEHLNFYAGMTSDGRPRKGTSRQQAEAWWAEVQSKGEKQLWINAVALGDTAGANVARKLVAKYPDAALEAIQAGMSKAADVSVSRNLVEAAAALPGNAPVDFLRSSMRAGGGIYARVVAADALLARGQTDAVPAMIEVWKSLQPRLPAGGADAFDEAGRLISFLAKSLDVRAMLALERDYARAPVDVRLAIVRVFLPRSGAMGGSFSTGPGVHVDAEISRLPAGETGAVIERLLVTALDDVERRFALQGNHGPVSYEDPRVCDFAALVLAGRWPQKYPFAWSATSMENDAQIIKMRDRWRSENGLPAIKNASPAALSAASEADLAPFLNAYAAASDAGTREKIAARIAGAYGAGAFAAVRARHEASGNEIFRPLAIDLAGRIREVRLEADAAGAAATLGIAAWKGARLDGESLAKLATDFQATLPKNVRSVSFFAERAGDGAGFTVSVRFIAGEVRAQNGWDRELSVRCGNTNVYQRGGYFSTKASEDAGAMYGGMKDAFEQAIQADPAAPVIARFRLQRSGVP